MTIYTRTAKIASYKGTGKIFNRVVRTLDRTQYSHTELSIERDVNGIPICWSSSFMDGGVRGKTIDLSNGHWDLIVLPITEAEYKAITDFQERTLGLPYDTNGMLGAGFMLLKQNQNKWFCNEWVGAALGIPEPYRFRPASFHIMVSKLAQDRKQSAE